MALINERSRGRARRWVLGRGTTAWLALALVLLLGAGAGSLYEHRLMVAGTGVLGVLITFVALVALNAEGRRRLAAAGEAEADRAHLAVTLESIGEAVLSVDAGGRIAFMNAVAVKLTGWSAEEARGQPVEAVFSIVHEQTRAPAEAPVARVLREGGFVGPANHTLLLTRDGREVLIEDSGAPIRDADGRVSGAVLVFRDVSERRRTEAALRQAKEAAESANRAKSAFLANMSHEIRTPMNAVLGYIQLLQRDPTLSREQAQHIAVIGRSGEHLLALINDVLEVSKIEAGIRKLHRVDVDMDRLFDDLERTFRARTDAKLLSLDVRRARGAPRYILADEGKLRQIVLNLLSNAVKFTARGGVTVDVGGRTAEGGVERLVVEVADTGPGISAEEQRTLFRPFAQARVGIEASGGAGLGLALSRELARLMGGDVTLESRPGEGSRFRLELPVERGHVPSVSVSASFGRVTGLTESSRGKRILLAEDDDDSRTWMRQVLEQVGFEVSEARDGAAAVSLVDTFHPHLVLLDMNMPVMNGYAAARAIRARPAGRGTVVLAVTASAFDEERDAILEAGVDGVLRKPCRVAELLEEIRTQLGLEYLHSARLLPEPARSSFLPELREAPGLHVEKLGLELAAEIGEAVVVADYDRLLALLDRAPAGAATVAGALRELAERYAYDEIARLLAGGEAKAGGRLA
jgi:two-component system, sensor histidine kinase and response regulator